MSVIIDAVKAAQREKARRESRGGPPSLAPVLVPLRTGPATGFDLKRVLVLSTLGIVIVGAGAAALAMSKSKTAALPAVPPITTILADAIADSGARPDSLPQRAQIVAATDPATPVGRPARTKGWLSPPKPTSRIAASAPRDTVATPQGGVRAPTGVNAADSGHSARPGRLRVAVDRPRQPEASRLFGEAVAAHQSGDLVTARLLYDSVLVLTPGDVDAMNNLAVLVAAQGEHSRAHAILRRAAAIAPQHAGVWNNIGTVFHQQGKSDEAIAAFRQALVLDPRHSGAKVGLAQQYLAISALPQARGLLEEVVAANPRLAEAQYTLGQVLELQGDRPAAIQAYDAFIKTAPARLASHVDLVRRRVEALNRVP